MCWILQVQVGNRIKDLVKKPQCPNPKVSEIWGAIPLDFSEIWMWPSPALSLEEKWRETGNQVCDFCV